MIEVDITTDELAALVEEAMAPEEEAVTIPDNLDLLTKTDNLSRFQGAMWFDAVQQLRVTIAGLGGIGSWTALLLSRLNVENIRLIDPDNVEEVNMAGQLYRSSHIGATKVSSTTFNIQEFSNYYKVDYQTRRIEECNLYHNILICGFDNMTARKNAFYIWKHRIVNLCPADREKSLFIDGRLDAEDLQIFCITGNDKHLMEIYEREYLYDDSDVEEAPCSFKQTSYLAAMIGSLITNLVVNFVSNTVVEFSKVLPFKISFNTSVLKLSVED
jgi:molybdopterin/thiamine biosynthesis adenylyltransferase